MSAAVPVERIERQLRDAIAVISERHEHGGGRRSGWLSGSARDQKPSGTT